MTANNQKPPRMGESSRPVSGQVLTELLRHKDAMFSRWCPVSIMDVKGWHEIELQAFDGLSRGLRTGMGIIMGGVGHWWLDSGLYQAQAQEVYFQRLRQHEIGELDFLFESEEDPTQSQHGLSEQSGLKTIYLGQLRVVRKSNTEED